MATQSRPMTPQDLLRIVTEITSRVGHEVATGDEIQNWCDRHGVDWGEDTHGNHFYEADHANAPSPLRKFKIERRGWTPASAPTIVPVTHVGENGWCLQKRWADACDWTTRQHRRWRAIPWGWDPKQERDNWLWQCAARVDRATPLATFDRNAIAASPFRGGKKKA